ncbi:MAG: hypothetical protein GTN70_06120 [Deltaproteobacteria bacterium]|nr:hypothetical protein [Deltaproteobacteria bacterium]NIS77256.1 hypothetical protein [Deltaproteobacteria bacterium]
MICLVRYRAAEGFSKRGNLSGAFLQGILFPDFLTGSFQLEKIFLPWVPPAAVEVVRP